MQFRYVASLALCAILLLGFGPAAVLLAQAPTATAQSDATPAQRLEVMRSRLDAMRRSLSSAASAVKSKDGEEKKGAADDPRARLRGLEQEVSSVLGEVNDLRAKLDRSERLEPNSLEKLESSLTDLDTRVQAGLRATVGERSGTVAAQSSASSGGKNKKKGGFFSRLLGRGGDDKYEELTGAVAPGRDRQLFEEAAVEVRKGRHETGRFLFNTIIGAYPDSTYLPLAKLAIADSFYLEGTTSALIQAAAAYQDWLAFFPTDPLADDVMLKMAEAEMRQMGLPDRDVSRARKAEQRLKVILQQFPNTTLKEAVQQRLNEVQENLGMHSFQVGNFYKARHDRGVGGLKGAQLRYREIVEKYPNFSYMDQALFNLGVLYMQEEEPDEAAKYFQQIARDYPNGEFAEKSREQLDIIGSPVSAPDPIKAKIAPPERPSLTQKLITQLLGTTPVTVDKNGVLISRDNKGSDLIDVAIANRGEIPSSTVPRPIEQRRPPARPVQQQQRTPTAPVNPAATTTTTTTSEQETNGNGIKVQPTQSGPTPDRINPAMPASGAPGSVSPSITPPSAAPASAPATPPATKP